MGLLEGKTALIFGLANERSIAWGITQAMHREGAKIGISYAGEMLERRVKPLAEQIGCKWVEECDVTQDDQIDAIAARAKKDFSFEYQNTSGIRKIPVMAVSFDISAR